MTEQSTPGIDHIAFYTPNQYLPLEELARARNVDPKKYTVGIGINEISVANFDEDAVVLAANAGSRVLEEAGVSPEDIGLLIVGTESADDKSKPTATHVHELLGISSACRVYDIVHACIGGTYGLLSALDWVAGTGRGRYALVIASDIARYERHSLGEPTQGGGAVAILVSANPRLLTLRELSTYSNNVYDFWKPSEEKYPIVDGMLSAQSYADAATNCFRSTDADLQGAFLYHCPYPKLVQQTHSRIAKLLGADRGSEHFSEHVSPFLNFSSRVGNVYTASLWLAFCNWIEDRGTGVNNKFDDCYVFSYGSGCGAALLHGSLQPGWEQMASLLTISKSLDSRIKIEITGYELLADCFEQSRVPSKEEWSIRSAGPFKLSAIEDHKRVYERV